LMPDGRSEEPFPRDGHGAILEESELAGKTHPVHGFCFLQVPLP